MLFNPDFPGSYIDMMKTGKAEPCYIAGTNKPNVKVITAERYCPDRIIKAVIN